MLRLDLDFAGEQGSPPRLVLRGEDALGLALLRHVLLDLEMVPDEDGNAVLQLQVPDRRMVGARSAPLAGEPFFALEEAFAGSSLRPRLELRQGGERESFDPSLAWCLLDFSGSWSRALEAVKAQEWDLAIEAARAAVEANEAREGFRLLLGRYLVRVGRDEEGRAAFEEERRRFPRSHRACCELAALAWSHLRREEATSLLEAALELYPNHLQSLLLLADVRLSGGRSDVVALLGRAWRLSAALAPRHVFELLHRRRREALLPAIRDEARRCGLDADGPVPGPSSSSPSSPPSSPLPEAEARETVASIREVAAPAGLEPPAEETPSLDLDPLTREELVRLAAREILRDGRVDPEEKLLFSKLCARFGAGAELVTRVASEEREQIRKRGLSSRSFDGPRFFRDVLERAFADGIMDGEETAIVSSCARLLGLSREEVVAAQQEILQG